jgi:hypothetical protein
MGRKKCYAAIWEPPAEPPPVRSLKDMTEAEIQALEKQYGVPVKRPVKGK